MKCFRLKLLCGLLCFLLLRSFSLHAQSIRLPNGTEWATLQNNRLTLTRDSADFLLNAKIIFRGGESDKNNIYALFTTNSFADKKESFFYKGISKTPIYRIEKNSLFTEVPDRMPAEVFSIQPRDTFLTLRYQNRELLRMPRQMPTGLVLLCAFLLDDQFHFSDSVRRSAALPLEPETANRPASIRPLYGPQGQEWIWDGEYLRPRWNADFRCFWKFDGHRLKPATIFNQDEEYDWDGEQLSPVWGAGSRRTWVSDGTAIRPAWDTDWNRRFEIQGKVIRAPLSNVAGPEWVVEGNFPLPLLVAIVSGTVRCL